jgi:hypothetical protein
LLRFTKARTAAGAALIGVGLIAYIPAASAVAPDQGTVHTLTAAGSDITYNVQLALDSLYEDSPGCTLVNVPAPGSTGQVGDGQKLNICSPHQPGPKSNPPGPKPVTTEDYSHDVIADFYPQGSTAGLYELCHQGSTGVPKLNFVRSGRAPSSTSDCTGLTGVQYANDGLAPVTFPGPITNAINAYNTAHSSTPFFFTKQALTELFATCVDNSNQPLVTWNQLDYLGPTFPSDPIKFWSVSASYGVQNVWAKYLGVPSPYTGAEACALAQNPSQIIPPSNASQIASSADPGDAIYFYSIGLHNVTDGQTSVLQPIGTTSAIQPTNANVQNQTWPVIHGLYNVYNTTTVTSNTLHYVGPSGWICADSTKHTVDPATGVNYATEIQQNIVNNGFVTIPDNGGSTCLTSNT